MRRSRQGEGNEHGDLAEGDGVRLAAGLQVDDEDLGYGEHQHQHDDVDLDRRTLHRPEVSKDRQVEHRGRGRERAGQSDDSPAGRGSPFRRLVDRARVAHRPPARWHGTCSVPTVLSASPAPGPSDRRKKLRGVVRCVRWNLLAPGVCAPLATDHQRHSWPCHSWPCHSWPCHSWPCHSWPCHSWPCHSWPCHSWPCHSWPCHSWPCHSWPCHSWPCHSWPCHSWPCHSWPCHSWPCHSAVSPAPASETAGESSFAADRSSVVGADAVSAVRISSGFIHGWAWTTSAAAPETTAAACEVPVALMSTPSSTDSGCSRSGADPRGTTLTIDRPGAITSTRRAASPRLENGATVPSASTAPTTSVAAEDAGLLRGLSPPSFPAATTTTMPAFRARVAACSSGSTRQPAN